MKMSYVFDNQIIIENGHARLCPIILFVGCTAVGTRECGNYLTQS